MVRGIAKFQEYFQSYTDNYVIIGGTACDIIIGEKGFTPRATKDIDIILIVEALTADFVRQFWQFIADGRYEHKQQSVDDRKYYRFLKPEKSDFPLQIELFARTPDVIQLPEGAHLTPIPTDEGLSSLSAILLDEDYYNYMIVNSMLVKDMHLANLEAIICLKAKAFLEIAERIANGSTEDRKQLSKHRTDILRLAVMLEPSSNFQLPLKIKAHLQQFTTNLSENMPEKSFLKEMGVGNVEVSKVIDQIVKSFNLTINE